MANETLLKQMYERYISPDSAIICYVAPCVADLNTTECWRLAGQADPAKKRTITIVTQIDLRCDDKEFEGAEMSVFQRRIVDH